MLPSSNNNQQRNANKENKDCVDRYLSGRFGSDPDIVQITRAGGKVCMAKPQHWRTGTQHPNSHLRTQVIQQLGDEFQGSSPSCWHSPWAVILSNTICEGQRVKQSCNGKSHRHEKGYIPRITASRHLIGKDSLVISFAVSINLEQKQNSFQSFQLEQLTGIKSSSHRPRARHLQFLSQQEL